MTETLRTDDGRQVLRIERRFSHPPEKVWRAITRPAQLSQWFPATVEFELAVGSEVRFDMGEAGGPAPGGTITVVDPPTAFAFTWEGELLRWELHPDGDGCLLVFSHTFDDRPGAASFCSGWMMCLDALRMIVDGDTVTHAAPSAELHDTYVARFGLDEPVVETGPVGWSVRVERQLTKPAEEAWALLRPPEEVRLGSVVRRQPPALLEYEWHHDAHPAGLLRWELGQGTGHGARLVITQTGPATLPRERDRAAARWPSWVADLAADIRSPAPQRTA